MLTSINAPERFQVPDMKGFYLIPHLDADGVVRDAIGRKLSFDEKFFHYGVADNALNIFEHHPELSLFDERNFVVFMTEIRREDQPTFDGWRWHKWGDYIGQHEPEYEYLADEEGIESVFVYRIFWLKE